MRSRSAVVVVGLAVTLALVTAACSSSPPKTGQSGQYSTVTTSRVPLPAGKYPSEISKEVCHAEAQHDIFEALGLKPVRISTPTWVNHLYSCTYEYPNGSFTLSVKELSSWSQTIGYFRGLGQQSGIARSLGNLGQGAFSETDGSVVVRKDWKVLTVDITGLPDQFGAPPTKSSDIAVTVADVILGCWAGD
jgi:hypothetical protein